MIDYYETKSQPITRVMVWQAYKEVKANAGSGGIDNMDWEHLEQNKSTEIYKLWNRLSSGSYFPKAVKQVAIPKKCGGVRNLGIPTLLDRIAQQVVRKHLERIVEPLFHKSSFGYRPKRSSHQAVEQANANSFNQDFALDLDIKGFFDNIDQELLMKAVQHYCSDKWVLLYISRWLKAGVVQHDGNFQPTLTGTPQGGVISPLLANIFLHVVFDKWMEKHHPEKPFERYADDIVVHCKTEKQAQFMLRAIAERMNICKLNLNMEKSKIVNLRGYSEKKYAKGFDFLGFTIRPRAYKTKSTGKTKSIPSICVSQKSKTNIMEKFKQLKLHKRRITIEALAKEINPILTGIINYYHKFWKEDMRIVWNQLNARLLKWVKWEKDLYKMASVRYLKTKYKERPNLFAHWLLVHP
ncbi:MAG TPA: group II intron reverse transcriptase/maturase [Chitinophagaceae bacterium]|nr:group II intron reverse transcriptase/maturase [Chitinophagaceae bacterium]